MRALIVDDSRAMRMVIGKLLREIGFQTSEAGHGREGLARLKELGSPPELMMVDWNMPEMNGLEFVIAVRGEPAYAPSRILMVTTESDLTSVEQALVAGADEYLMKPFNKESLIEKLALVGIEP